MSEWFQAGYFTMTLQVKRGCDEMFQPLGEMIKLWGRVPFTPGPTLPPILVNRLDNLIRLLPLLLSILKVLCVCVCLSVYREIQIKKG